MDQKKVEEYGMQAEDKQLPRGQKLTNTYIQNYISPSVLSYLSHQMRKKWLDMGVPCECARLSWRGRTEERRHYVITH